MVTSGFADLDTPHRMGFAPGSEPGSLLDVLDKALGHARAHSFEGQYLLVATGAKTLDEGFEAVAYRAGLVSRHITDAQNALKEIHRIAQERGYTDITAVFEREYKVGHPRE